MSAAASEEVVSRAKFRCASYKKYSDGDGPVEYEFTAVYDDGIPENKRFHKYSPSGRLVITVDNPNVNYKVGKSYYLDFIEAEE